MDGLTPLLDKHRKSIEDSVITSQPMEMTLLDFNQNNSRKKRDKVIKKSKKANAKKRGKGGGYSSSIQVSKGTSTSSLDESYLEYLRTKKKKKKGKKRQDAGYVDGATSGSGLESTPSSRSGSRQRVKKSQPDRTIKQEESDNSPHTAPTRQKPKRPVGRDNKKRLFMTSPTTETSPTPSESSPTSIPESPPTSDTEEEEKKKKKRRKPGGLFAHMCKSSPNESRLLKAVLWFPIGCVIALILYFLIIRKMNMEEKTKAFIGAAIGAILALSFAFSSQIRCTVSLVLPSFMGKAGRSYITAFAIIYLIDGPITNIIGNTKEVVRSLTCTSSLMSNHSKTKWKLRLHPIEGALADISKDNFHLNKVARGIKRAFRPLRREILKNMVEQQKLEAEINEVEKIKKEEADDKNPDERGNGETVRRIEAAHKNDGNTNNRAKEIEKEWKKKLDLRCQDIFSKGVLRCREKMKQLERKCKKAIKFIGRFLCLPLKIRVFCNIVKLIPKALGVTCRDLDVVRPGLGETFISARAVVDDMDQGMNVKMQYRLAGDPEGVDYTPVEEVRAATMHEVEERSAFLKLVFSMISSVLTFTFLIVFKSAYNYNKNYLTELQYDNVYITNYFKHIDSRRQDADKDTLLPLKKFEKQDIIDPMKIRLSKEEKGQIKKGTGRLILRVIIAAIICYMDSLLYQVLDIIARNSRVEYHQEGEHFIKIKVQGTGFMSVLVRNILLRFNTNHTLDQVTTNHHCLPDPEETDDLIIGFIFGTYFLVWVFMYFESFGLRMRHIIAGFFFRKHEKKRVLRLYNEMFRRRKGYLAHLRKVIRKSIRKRKYKKKTSIIVSLQRQYPKYFGWLRVCKSTKENCVICEDKQDEDFYLCETPGCGIGYCEQCWVDVKEKCLACRKKRDEKKDDDDDGEGDGGGDGEGGGGGDADGQGRGDGEGDGGADGDDSSDDDDFDLDSSDLSASE